MSLTKVINWHGYLLKGWVQDTWSDEVTSLPTQINKEKEEIAVPATRVADPKRKQIMFPYEGEESEEET